MFVASVVRAAKSPAVGAQAWCIASGSHNQLTWETGTPAEQTRAAVMPPTARQAPMLTTTSRHANECGGGSSPTKHNQQLTDSGPGTGCTRNTSLYSVWSSLGTMQNEF